VSTADSTTYTPSRADAAQIVAAKSADLIMDRADLASLTRGLATIEERRQRAERGLQHMGAEIAIVRDQLEMLRLQLP